MSAANPRPLPSVGDRIVMRYPEPNPNNWRTAGEVRAIVDGCAIIVRRRMPRARFHAYELITAVTWDVFDPARNGAMGGLVLLPRGGRK